MKQRTVISPVLTDLAVRDGKLSFWKRVLPEGKIKYIDDKTGKSREINFDRDYLTTLCDSYSNGALDQTPFQLADASNRHTMDPERFRGEATEMRLAKTGEEPGLWAKMTFANKRDAKAVLANPKLGVSARIREGVTRADGKSFPAAIIHVLGTLDPKITGLGSWKPAMDFSEYADGSNVVDLSEVEYPEDVVAKGKSKSGGGTAIATRFDSARDIGDYTDEEIDSFSDEDLQAFLVAAGVDPDEIVADADADGEDDDDTDDDGDGDDDTDDQDDTDDGGPKLSNAARREINLARSEAREANARAGRVEAQANAARWKVERDLLLSQGVPPHIIDAAEPVLSQSAGMVLDLSNADGDDEVDVTQIVRDLVEGYAGRVDVDVELGHASAKDDDGELVDEALALWESKRPLSINA